MNERIKRRVEARLASEVDIKEAGVLQGIVWGRVYAGVNQEHSGYAVTQQQHGMRAYHFYVLADKIRFRGRWLHLGPRWIKCTQKSFPGCGCGGYHAP